LVSLLQKKDSLLINYNVFTVIKLLEAKVTLKDGMVIIVRISNSNMV
jgi:hypothetical protein